MRTVTKYLSLSALALLSALLGCGAAGGDDLSSSGASITPSSGTPLTTGPTFNNPSGTALEKDAIQAHLEALITGATAGSKIQVSLYTFAEPTVATLLVAAKSRGVTVQVIIDHSSATAGADGVASYDELKKLGEYKATTEASASWVLRCTVQFEACSALRQPGMGSVNHNKFYLFSHTSGEANDASAAVSDVVMQTSANLTAWDRNVAFNDAMTVVGNTALYGAYERYFQKLREAGSGAIAHTDNYDVTTPAGAAEVYYFPRSGSDPIVDIMHRIDCRGNGAGYGNANGRTIIRIAMHQFDRIEVAQALWERQNAGCRVEVVYAKLDANGSAVKDKLAEATPNGGRITTYELAGHPYADHDKYMVVDGAYDGDHDKKIVFMGSETYTASALRSNDETVLRYDSDDIVDAYLAQFETVRAAAETQDE